MTNGGNDRAFLYATEIVDFCRPQLPPGAIVRELAKQLVRSGRSISANLEEADAAESKPDSHPMICLAMVCSCRFDVPS
jgi:four helix bundle protein